MNKVVYYIITTALLSVGVFTEGDGTWVSWTALIALIIVMMVITIATALQQADAIYDNEITKSMFDKTEVLKKYYEWKEKKVLKETIEDKIIKVRLEKRVLAQKKLYEEKASINKN